MLTRLNQIETLDKTVCHPGKEKASHQWLDQEVGVLVTCFEAAEAGTATLQDQRIVTLSLVPRLL